MTPVIDRSQLVRRILDQYGAGAPDCEDNVHRESAGAYTDSARFEAEKDRIFRRSPVVVALSGEVANPGDFKTLELAGAPLIIIRGRDGVVRGFRNSCAHRGAQVLTESRGCGVRRISCPYHGWTYDTEGKLSGVPFRQGFPDLDTSASGLSPIQVDERWGLIFTVVDADEPYDIDEFLGDLGPQLNEFGCAHFVASEPDSAHLKTNWKLAVDTFGESYHFPYVHTDTLMPIVKRNTMATDYYGPHLREVFGLQNIDQIADDELKWRDAQFGIHMYPIYIVFPNTVIAIADGAMQLFVTYPGRTVGECEVVHLKGFDPSLPPDQRNGLEYFFDYNWINVVQPQDFPIAVGIFEALSAGSRPHVTFGRQEGPLHHLHKHYDKAISGFTG